MLRRLWDILGPVICAGLLVVLLFACVPRETGHSFNKEKQNAVALTKLSFKSKSQKLQALTDPDHRFVPFFGSSEWLRFDSMHPSVLAEAYDRPYTPYLLGQRGAASLTHYFGMQQINDSLKGQQAVYVISPQWFVVNGANAAAFQNYFNNDQMISFLQHQSGNAYDRYAAQRFQELYPGSSMEKLTTQVADGKSLSGFQKSILAFKKWLYEKEDAFFSRFTFTDKYQSRVVDKAKDLPKEFSYDALEKVASKDGKAATSNNDLGISNGFYRTRIEARRASFKGSQKHYSYVKSPEYNDFQLVLKNFADQGTDVLFVIPPVNTKWANYTGLSQEMYRKTVAKIKYQLQSQGFNHVADLSEDGDKPYFMQDTIHLGWNGWLALDKVLNPFLTQEQAEPHYTIQDKFLAKKWANYTGDVHDY